MVSVEGSQAVQRLEDDLVNERPVSIKVFNLGENLGADFAYFCHFHVLRKLFPGSDPYENGLGPEITMARSNVEDTNAIGFGQAPNYLYYVPVEIAESLVKQHYPDGKDWVQKLQAGELSILSEEFRSTEQYKYVTGYGMGDSEVWRSQYDDQSKWITIHELTSLLHKHAAGRLPDLEPAAPKEVELITADSRSVGQWSRMAMEYKCFEDEEYPFQFDGRTKNRFAQYGDDYLYVSLREPDHVRWYYSVDRQYDLLFSVINRLRSEGKPVKIVYTLKDGEVGNNFNKGQDIRRLKMVQDLADDVLFHYCWTENPRRGRPTEEQELARLKQAGITNVVRTNIWEALALAAASKVYLSEPAGFAEIITVVRRLKPETTFLFPSSAHQLNIYVTRDQNGVPLRHKVNPVCFRQSYTCIPKMGPPDENNFRFVSHWDVRYGNDRVQIGDNCQGDDWKYFRQAQDTVFKDWFHKTKQELIESIAREIG